MRKTSNITIQDEGRDKDKVFVLTEKPAIEADKWGIRALLALSKSGVPIPPEFMEMGIIGVLAVGVHRLAGVSFTDLEPLLDEMLTCVQIMPTPERPDIIRKLLPDDIEEVKTLQTLRMEVFRLHTGFSPPAKAPVSPTAPAGANPSNIRTSRRQSAR
ncbi:conserved hypothetical protein [Bradyrhizobium sp. STM 3843]|uniref:hypothetical protein n=1 Tax=Bradyrhizobium sp. STM 3843 TaxID=551947 RepID=UPI0002403027|nr:hypothetical protein [Bradyrhizobium sp. STM 3843]CCE07598.1 conserved hypothetical protein [Bradyrhizobium sp. STM 3843]